MSHFETSLIVLLGLIFACVLVMLPTVAAYLNAAARLALAEARLANAVVKSMHPAHEDDIPCMPATYQDNPNHSYENN